MKNIFRSFYLLLIPIFCLFFIQRAFGTESIGIIDLKVYPDSLNNRALIETVIEKAALLANRRYKPYITVDSGKTGIALDYTLNVNAVFQEENPVLVISMKRKKDDQETEPFPISGRITPETTLFLANVIFYQWSSFHDYLSSLMEEPLSFVDEISADIIAQTALPGMPSMLVPTSVAVKANGNFLVGFSMLCVEFDRYFSIVDQPGKSLYESGNYTYAGGVSVTPGGTIFLKPAMGREIYRLVEGMTRPQKWRTGIDLTGPFTALFDGSVVAIDLQKKKALRIMAKKKQELNLFSGPYSYISTIASGPEGNIWIYDSVERRVKVYTATGEFLDSIIPLFDHSSTSNPFSMSVYADGSFVLFFSTGEMLSFHRNGIPFWKMDKIPGPGAESLPQIAYISLDSDHGLIYMADQMGRRILKFLDSAYCAKHKIKNPFEEQIATLNKRQWQDENDTKPTVRKAKLYEEKGSYEMAKLQWEKVFELDPFHKEADAKLAALEITIMKANANVLKNKTINILESIGPETARQYYTQTLKLYEKILSLNPLEKDIQYEIKSLKELFGERERDILSPKKAITIVELSLDNLFPALMQYYRTNPIGKVTVQNSLSDDVTDLKATIYMKKYMDFPSESGEISRLKPGESATLDLTLLLNSSIFELQEDLPVQAKVEITYTVNGIAQTQLKYGTLTIYRRTALLWDDTGKISSFIMPNESTITGFSHRVPSFTEVESHYRLPKKFFRAMRIYDALGTYGISYIEDPDSPLSQVLGKREVVDTVRFPRTTLLIRSGDCDDTTVLLGSLFESAGISTAIMTSPGHVFLAFDSEEPLENAWIFRTQNLEIAEYRNTAWIPIETTVLKNGFIAAWEEASRLLKQYSGTEDVEFLPVEKERDKYPPLPLSPSSFSVVEPSAEEIEKLYRQSIKRMKDVLYEPLLSDLLKKQRSEKSKSAVKLKNNIGILHARFGKDSEAEKAFLLCIDKYPDYLLPYINLANLKLSNGDVDASITILKKAFKKKPESTFLNLLLARCYHQKGDQINLKRHFAIVEKSSPEVAKRYNYLVQRGTKKERAKEAEDAPLIWASIEE